MNPDDDGDDILAAEYVLGTLDYLSRRRVERRMDSDRSFHARVMAWSDLLFDVHGLTSSVKPPSDVWQGIAAEIERERTGTPVDRGRDAKWKPVALAASLGFLLVGAALVLRLVDPPSRDDQRYVAVLNGDAGQPAMILSVDTSEGVLTINPLRDVEVVNQALQLWLLPVDGSAPRPLGLASASSKIRLPVAVLDAEPTTEMSFAISLEPPGGSPTGQPTGPILFTGPLLTVPD